MKARYNIIIRVEVVHEIEQHKLCDLKGNFEMGNDLCQMICDEIAMSDGVGCCDVLESGLTVE